MDGGARLAGEALGRPVGGKVGVVAELAADEDARLAAAAAAPGDPGGGCAEMIAQPIKGMTTIAPYSRKWTMPAVWISHVRISAGWGGGWLIRRQRTRITVNASTERPADS